MSQLLYSPFGSSFGALDQLHRELGRVFDDQRHTPQDVRQQESADWTPAVDIFEDEQGFGVALDLPGVDPKDVDITVDKNVLSITGQRANSNVNEGTKFRRQERFAGSFNRQFTLPDSADGTNIKARSDKGVLHIVIPKGEKNKPLNIAIES